jgi:integrase/recombinase XerD
MPADDLSPLPWVIDARGACRDWLTHSVDNYAEQSVAQYTAMVGTAADWLHLQRDRHLLNARANDLDAFLTSLRGRNEQAASASTVQRYVSTLAKLYMHLVAMGLRQDSPVEPLQRQPGHSGPVRSAPRFLDWEQSEQFIAWLSHQPTVGWCEERDAALRCIYLATGITVEESLQLKQADLRVGAGGGSTPATLHVRTRSPLTTRQLVLPAWSLPILQTWSRTRATLGVTGQVLFVARRRSPTVSSDGGEPSAQPISTSELYEIIRPAVEAAGLADGQLGPQTLRNSYAVRQLSQGVDDATLMRWMGLRTAFSLDAIRREMNQLGGTPPA